MSATQSTLGDYQNSTPNTNDNTEDTETVHVKDVMPAFTDWRNHPNNPDNTQ